MGTKTQKWADKTHKIHLIPNQKTSFLAKQVLTQSFVDKMLSIHFNMQFQISCTSAKYISISNNSSQVFFLSNMLFTTTTAKMGPGVLCRKLLVRNQFPIAHRDPPPPPCLRSFLASNEGKKKHSNNKATKLSLFLPPSEALERSVCPGATAHATTGATTQVALIFGGRGGGAANEHFHLFGVLLLLLLLLLRGVWRRHRRLRQQRGPPPPLVLRQRRREQHRVDVAADAADADAATGAAAGAAPAVIAVAACAVGGTGDGGGDHDGLAEADDVAVGGEAAAHAAAAAHVLLSLVLPPMPQWSCCYFS